MTMVRGGGGAIRDGPALTSSEPRAVNPKNGKHSPMISPETYKAIMDNKDQLDGAIIYERDFHYVSLPMT